MIKLRPYQEQLITDVREAFRHNRSVLLVLATGGGKTVTFSEMIRRALGNKKRTWAMCHRQELVDQIGGTLHRFNIPHGYIAAGSEPNPFMEVQVCSIMTLARRYKRLQSPYVVIVDEAHHSASSTWAELIRWIKDNGGMVLGVTATPERLDGKGLDSLYSAMVEGPSTGNLIDDGFLCQPRVFAPSHGPDLSGIHTRMGDFAKDELARAMTKPKIIGDMVEHYLRLCPGKRSIGFYVNIDMSKQVVEDFNASGVPAAHLDANTPKPERERIVKEFSDGTLLHLGNVDLFGEGFDVPGIEAVIMGRPTQSLTLFLQQAGRGLRPVYANGFDLETQEGRLASIAASVKPHALILDHAGNTLRHGMPDDERQWSLSGRPKRSKAEGEDAGPKVRQCPTCYGVHPATLLKCPYCEHVYEVKGRAVEQVDGTLQEVHQKRKLVQNKELNTAKTEGELIALARKNHHPNPIAFANSILHARRKWENKNAR